MDLSPLQIIAGAASSAAGGGGVSSFFTWLGSRSKTKAYTMGAVDHAVQTAMTLVTDRLAKVEGQHEACEDSLREVRSELAERKAEIDRLMSGRVAAFGEGAPK